MNTVFGNIEGATTFGAPNVNETFSKNYQNKIDSRQFEQTVRNIGHPDDMINNLTFGKDRMVQILSPFLILIKDYLYHFRSTFYC